MDTKDTGVTPAILFSNSLADQPKELPLGLEGFPTEISVKVGDQMKKFPVAYFDKDVIECGTFRHPTTGQEFSVDEKRIDGWVAKFNQMRDAGVEIKCPVDHSDKAEDNRGFALKMRRDGKKLKFTPQVFGDDGALLALRNRCSVKITPDFIDEKGKHWGEALEHVAFTPIPVISGQGPFVPIAASRGQQSVPVFYLSASQRSPAMDLTKIRAIVGADKEITDEQLIELAVTKLGEGTKALSDLTGVQTKLTESESKVTTLSRQLNPTAPDPEIMADRADNYADKLDIAVEKGELPLTLAKKIKAKVLPEPGNPSAFMLSRHVDLGVRPIDFILDLFAGEKLGTATGSTTVVQLSREVPGKTKEEPVTEDRKKELLAMSR